MATRPMPQAMMTEAVTAFEAAGGVLDRAAAALNLLVEAANGVSTGFMRLIPDVIPTPRQRPEPL